MFQDAGNSDILETCETPCVEYRDKFIRAVNQFLDLYHGSEVRTFEVLYCLSCHFSDDIDRWISFDIRMGVENLCIKLFCRKCCFWRRYALFGQRIEADYVFKSELFEGRESSNLKLLSLTACSLGPNFTNHFSCLNTLRLSHVPLFSYDVENMFSCLINLEDLSLIYCSLPETLCFGSLALLKSLCIIADRTEITKVKLSNAKLQTFTCQGLEIDFDFRGAPNLEIFHHATAKEKIEYVFTCMSEHFPKLKVLTVSTRANWVTHIPESITTFRNVEKLYLIFSYRTKFDMLRMIAILRAFPVLKTLILETHCSEEMDQGKLERSEYVHGHLKEVKIGGFYDTPNQTEFAIYLLKQAISLERLIITPSTKYLSASRQSWDDGEREKVYEQLQKFSKDAILIVS